MIWSKYLSPMLIALMVLLLVGCESKEQENPVSAVATQIPTPTLTPLPTSTPEPSPTPNPLVPVMEKYMSDVEQFQVKQNLLSKERVALTKSRIVPSGWKANFAALLASETKLIEEWKMIEPPIVFLGFHESYESGLTLFIERHDLFTSWLDTYDDLSATRSAPWEQDTAIADEQQRVFRLTSESWDYGTAEYRAVAGIKEVVRPVATVRPTPTARTYPKSVTKALFDSLRMGMSHRQVQNIVGISCELISEVSGFGSEFNTAMYQCDGSGSLGANMNYMIQGGKLVSKAQFGLR